MTVVAIAKVGYQKNEGDADSVVWFEPGEEVDGAPKDVVEQWEANGSVGNPPEVLPSVVAEKEALEERVADLEAQLAAAKEAAKPTTPVPTKATPTKATP